jgi:type II secretory pathway component GspD/PulD (secretin)
MEYGVNYLIRYQGASGNGLAAAVLNPLLFPAGSGAGTTGGLPIPASITGPAALTSGLQSLSGLTVFGTIADSVDVYARFLESTNKFRTLSRPIVYTTNNRKAVILSGENVPVPSSTLTTATGGGINNNGTAVTANIQYTPVLLKLEVIPLVNSDREVNLQIVQTNDKVLGFDDIAGTKAPRIGTQQIKTNIRVPNGSTIVLGGLITEDKAKNKSGIPYVSRIPVIGSLLGGRTDNKIDKNELIVMIQPIVVDSNEEMMKASAYEADRTKLGMDAQETAAPIAEQARPAPAWTPKPTPKPRKN